MPAGCFFDIPNYYYLKFTGVSFSCDYSTLNQQQQQQSKRKCIPFADVFLFIFIKCKSVFI
ncbi:hypothetical protein CPT03_03945 [Pedobacter ginsengisoli]|uniref:Uncharacterized protein n=1 Tax=Pedobacter ginsengisoli TaxID=363852 RepID=A0A2D1U264_9SPHI|nr:hypothetical protein CPT03_03945 [Pedobacter ginsengisoli]